MPEPMAICLEDLAATGEQPRYLRCVAVVGRQPGLRVDGAGSVLWRSDEAVACELWVSADNRLILYRPEGAAAVTVQRAGRSLEVPGAKPVVLIDKDEFAVGEKRLRVHVHGRAPQIAAPEVFHPPANSVARFAKAAAAAAFLTAAMGCGDGGDIDVRDSPPTPPPDIDIREQPPEVMPPDQPDQPAPPDEADPRPPELPIEIREQPPLVMPGPEPGPLPEPPGDGDAQPEPPGDGDQDLPQTDPGAKPWSEPGP